MPNTVYTMESANLICGDTGNETSPGVSTHLEIQDMKLPALEENYIDHTPGGAKISIEIPTHIQKLESTFQLAGWKPEVMTMIGRSAQALQVFTAYGLIRDRRSGVALQAKAIMHGKLGRVNPTNFRKGDMMSHEYSIRSIVHYELYMQETAGANAETEIYWWDFFTSQCRIGGEDLNEEMIRVLAIPGVAI